MKVKKGLGFLLRLGQIFEMNNQRFDYTKQGFFYYKLESQHLSYNIVQQIGDKFPTLNHLNHPNIFCYSDILYPSIPQSFPLIASLYPFMYRQVKYTIKIQPQPQKNLRKNINALYIILISQKDNHKLYSQPILVDTDRQDEIYSTNDIEYNRVELWNYDRMKLIEEQKTAFNISDNFTFISKAEEITYSITKSVITKSNKMVQPLKNKQLVPNGRKNSQGQNQNSTKNKQDDASNKTESQEQSSRNTRTNKSPSIRIISVKQYHAY